MREREWAEWTKKYGNGIVGTLAPSKNIYAGAFVESRPAHTSGKTYMITSSDDMADDPADIVDRRSDEYITGVTASDLLRSFQN